MCQSVQNLMISPLSGDPPINLENALTQNLPNVINDIPTPTEVSSIPGLSHLSSKFPTKQNWPTILLLGRDCMQAQIIIQQVPSRDKNQLAVETPLGWTIIGKPARTTKPLKIKSQKVFKILQRPIHLKKSTPFKNPSKSYFAKPLEQRMAEYSQHRARIFGYTLEPGVFYINRQENQTFMTKAYTTNFISHTAKGKKTSTAKRNRKPKSSYSNRLSVPNSKNVTDDGSLDTIYRSVSNAQAQNFTQQHSSEEENLATSIKGSKEDELPGYTQEEILFLKDVITKTKIRPDNMIELPLPFTETRPTFAFNRTLAKKRTTNTLETMRKKEPEFFQKCIEKFAKNSDKEHPRFEHVPYAQKYNADGQAYWIPLFSVKQKGKARIVFDSAA